MNRRLIINENERSKILNMHETFKRNKYVIEEQDETFNADATSSGETSAVMADQAQTVLNNVGVDVPVTSVVDPQDCGCQPQTGDPKHDGIIARIWQWANNPENRGSLKSTLVSLKDAIKKAKDTPQPETTTGVTATEGVVNEQAGAALITIGGVALGPSVLIAIGVLLLVIIAVAIISKAGGRRRSPCKRRSRLFKRHGIDGMFM